ncbi:hypothetical protein BV25DRAFT_1922395 [Artomyces pyxidatus]|uniref:Uncharacterized protein n=1 Tax=Artomyces pyxidatus TaxID=48021 RepID=A0ACB8SEV1_9AGAM|nr:hypothetical protein BV25DRAFT_1922395 [Artomyces pyxidatus]
MQRPEAPASQPAHTHHPTTLSMRLKTNLTRPKTARRPRTSGPSPKSVRASKELKEACHADAKARKPLNAICSKCGSRHSVFEKLTLTGEHAGWWNSVCRTCNYGWYAPQVGPSEEQQEIIEGIRQNDIAHAQLAAEERRQDRQRQTAARRQEKARLAAAARAARRTNTASGAGLRTAGSGSSVSANCSTQGRATYIALGTANPSCGQNVEELPVRRTRQPLVDIDIVNYQGGRGTTQPPDGDAAGNGTTLTNMDVIDYPDSGSPPPYASDPVDSDEDENEDDDEHGDRSKPLTDRCDLTHFRVVFWMVPFQAPHEVRVATRTDSITLAGSPEFMTATGLRPDQLWEQWDFRACSWNDPRPLTQPLGWRHDLPILGRLYTVNWATGANLRRQTCVDFAQRVMWVQMALQRRFHLPSWGLRGLRDGDHAYHADDNGDDDDDGDDGSDGDVGGGDGDAAMADETRASSDAENVPPQHPSPSGSTYRSRVLERVDEEMDLAPGALLPTQSHGRRTVHRVAAVRRRATRQLARPPAPYPGPTRGPAHPVAGPSNWRRRAHPPTEEWDDDRERWYVDVDAQDAARDDPKWKGKGTARAPFELR